MSHHTLYTIATDRYIALRQEADQSRLARPASAVPSAPPARIRRLVQRVANMVLSHVSPAPSVGRHPA